MADHGVACRQHGLLLNELAHVDLVRQRTQPVQVHVVTGRDDDPVHRRALRSAEGRCPQEVARLRVEDGPERDVNGPLAARRSCRWRHLVAHDVPAQRIGRASERRRERRQGQVPMKDVGRCHVPHPELREQVIQRVVHQLGKDELPGSDDDDHGVRDACRLGCDGSTEVNLVAHDDVWPPRPDQLENGCCARPAQSRHEVVRHDLTLGLDVIDHQRCMNTDQVGPGRREGQALRRNGRRERGSAGDQHVVTSPHGVLCQWQERLQMPVPPGCREEDAQRGAHAVQDRHPLKRSDQQPSSFAR